MRFNLRTRVATAILASTLFAAATRAETFVWKNVKIGGGGGFVPNIIYNPVQPGLVYARTDMGGLYRLDTVSKTWIPLTDWVAPEKWNMLGGESFATDPVQPNICYFAAGTYTNDWTDMNGQILRSTNYGDSWTAYPMPIKFGGNMPGRGMGERLNIDPRSDNILYFGARSGNGLWKSTNSGQTWAQVTSFPVTGDYVQDPQNAYTADPLGVVWMAFDTAASAAGHPSAHILVGVAQSLGNTVYESNDTGATWSAVAGQPLTGLASLDSVNTSGTKVSYQANVHLMPHHGVIRDSFLFIPYNNKGGPYDGSYGEVWKYNLRTKNWTDITPHTHEKDEAWGTTTLQKESAYFGYGGFDVDPRNPRVIVAATLNSYWPDAVLFKSVDGGASWTKSFYWTSYPSAKFKYTLETTYPWLNWGVTTSSWPDNVEPKLGWMISGIAISPFNSDEMMYGTGATIYGTSNFSNWGDTTKPLVAFKSVAEGIEECAVLALAVPPIASGANSDVKLVSGVGDIGGFTHTDLQTSTQMFLAPVFGSTSSIDYAELAPTKIVRTGSLPSNPAVAFSFTFSDDGGKSWSNMYVLDTTYKSGTIAMSASGAMDLWAANDKDVKLINPNVYTATTVSTIHQNAVVASDRVADSTFYASYDSAFYYGSNLSYTANVSTGYPSGTYKIKAVPGRQGHVWVPTGTHGLWVTKDGGKTFSKLDTTMVQQADIIGYGKAAPGQTYPAMYITGKVSGTTGVFLSKDSGSTWTRINDDAHQYGAINAAITGDMRQYGIVFVGTNGRGIVYGDVTGSVAIKAGPATHTGRLVRSGRILTATGGDDLKLFDLRGTVLRIGHSDGHSARLDMAGLGAGLYFARWGRNSQAVLLGG